MPAPREQQHRPYDVEAAISLWLEPSVAERRHLKLDTDGETGRPIVSQSWLQQMRKRNERRGLRPGDPEFHGPPYRKIGRRYYYLAAAFDRYVLDDLFDLAVSDQGDPAGDAQ